MLAGDRLDLDRSALSVQGPPGTGKTHVASQVIAHLVRDHGWRVGVCAQSHAAIENVLSAIVAAGVDPDQVAKMTKERVDPPWTDLASADDLAGFAAAMYGFSSQIGSALVVSTAVVFTGDSLVGFASTLLAICLAVLALVANWQFRRPA